MTTELEPEIMTPGEREMLCIEARYLHVRLFRQCSSDSILSAYVSAHAEIPDLHAIDEHELRTVRIIVAHRLDAVGIEPWLRRKRTRHALSAKILLLAYLAECDACHLEFSRSVYDGRMAFAKMGCAVLSSIYPLLRGRLQKVWYGLV